jgi:hypothetical protein
MCGCEGRRDAPATALEADALKLAARLGRLALCERSAKGHAAFASVTVSTRIDSAKAVPMASRALHTWQTTIVCDETSLTTCSSPKPISRRCVVISGESGKRLMRTDAPARARLRGHNGCASHCSGNVAESGAQVMDASYRTRQRPPPAGCSTLVLFCLVPGVFWSGRASPTPREHGSRTGGTTAWRLSARAKRRFSSWRAHSCHLSNAPGGIFQAIELSMIQSRGAVVSP